MGVINKLRDKMGKVVVFAVGISILSFVAADLLGPNSAILGNQQQLVGEIKGQKITYPEFTNEINRLKTVFFVNNDRTPNSDENETIRQQAWASFLRNIGYGSVYDKLGVIVTDEEMVDMVQGENIHPAVRNAFTDPNTGIFDQARLIGYLQNLETLDPKFQRQWAEFEKSLKPERRMAKLTALMSKTVYATKYDLEREHIKNNAKASGSFLYVPYFSIPDSSIEVTNEVLEEVLEERKEEFKLKDNIFFDYVSFPIIPSAEDSAYYWEEMNSIASEFGEYDDDTSYIKMNSDLSSLPTFYAPNSIPAAISDTIAKMEAGQTYGPVEEASGLVIYKLISKGTDSTGQYVKASHILIQTEDRSETEAESLANSILSQARSGADFASLARQYSDGPSGPGGGDLGWFGKGQMVKEFEEASFSMEEPGVYPSVVKTQFGYHIIKVFEAKSEENFLIGSITRTISASDDTRDEVFRKADFFAGTSEDADDFAVKAAEQGLAILKARNVGKNDPSVNGIANVQQVIRWGFADGEPGDISKVFELEDQFMVCLLTAKLEEGYAEVDDIEERLKPYALKRLKAKDIIERLEQLPEQSDLQAMVDAFGNDAKLYTANGTAFNGYSLTGLGFDPAAVGYLFGLVDGNRTPVLEGENGVYILSLEKLEPAPAPDNLDPLKASFTSRYENYANAAISETIADDAEIKDNRYRFF